MVTSIPLHTGNRASPSLRATTRMAFALLLATGCVPRATSVTVHPETLEMRVTRAMRQVLTDAVRDSAFPGAVAIVGNGDRTLAIQGVGVLDRLDVRTPDEHTVWDMASLTKVLATTSALMQLTESGRVALDTPVVRYLPQWNAPGSDRVTVRSLLTHSSGLPDWRPLYRETGDAASARHVILETAPDSLAMGKFVYSDIGFMLLGLLVEQITGDSLHVYTQTRLFEPLGMGDTRFRPDSAIRDRVAPTEQDAWRGRHLRGEVHDENAYRLDGVSGHAGLFSTGADVARFARMLLRGGELDGVRLHADSIVRLFTRRQDSGVSNRALGWETPNGSNSGGGLLSARAFGHTGFTGTSVWIDPGQELFIVLLTNRVNPTRENRRISGVRIALVDSIASIHRAMSSRPFLEGGAGRH